MLDLDFEGEYGRSYARSIRLSIPAYDDLLEIGNAALAAFASDVASVLVVGPGLGEELPGMFSALPAAHFTLLEPSAQMRRSCASVIEREAAGGRCLLLEHTLQQACHAAIGRFAVVICHHVLHLMPPAEQRQALRLLVDPLADGGLLLLSSYSEPVAPQALTQMLSVASSRLRRLGIDDDTLALFLASRNKLIFALASDLLAEELDAAGLEPPQLLLQALGSHLWISRRPGSAASPNAAGDDRSPPAG